MRRLTCCFYSSSLRSFILFKKKNPDNTLTIIQDSSTGLPINPLHLLPIFLEDDPKNCENPKCNLPEKPVFKNIVFKFGRLWKAVNFQKFRSSRSYLSKIKVKQWMRFAGNTVSANRHFINGRANMAVWMFSNSRRWKNLKRNFRNTKKS